jgi:hypothetical protein
MLDNRKVIIDDALAIASTGSTQTTVAGAGTIDGVAKVIDTGGGSTEGKFVVDIARILMSPTVGSHSVIKIALQGSATSVFTTWQRLAVLPISGTTATGNNRHQTGSTAATPTTGRYILPFCNDFHGTVYRYLRVYHSYEGTLTALGALPGIKYKAWLTKK